MKQMRPRDPEPSHFPLSSQQTSQWILDQLQPGSAFYHNVVGMRLRGALHPAVLERSIRQIVARHDSLRTRFELRRDEPVQLVAPAMQLSMPVTDLGQVPQEERETRAAELAADEGRRPFDLAKGPLLRTRLLRLSEDDHILVLTFHHIVCDAGSVVLFLRELVAIYGAVLNGGCPDLPELPVQYPDYAIWQRHRLEEREKEDLAYWVAQLGDASQFLELPTDRVRPQTQTYRGAFERFRLDTSTTEALRDLSRAERSTLFMTVLAGFQALLHRYTGQQDVLVGTPVTARARPELDGLIGFFLNTLVMRGHFGGDPTFRELLRATRKAVLGGFSHMDLPFDRLVAALRPPRDQSHNPIFQVMLAFQQTMEHATSMLSMPGVSIELMPLDTGTSRFDLTLCVFDSPAGLDGVIEYSTEMFDAATIANLGAHLTTVLEAAIADPEQRISRLPLLTRHERHHILGEWSGTSTPHPGGRCVHELFQDQADRTPGAAAVLDRGRRMSYAVLNGLANQLARRLVGLGVGPETVVGLCADRSVEMVVGLLAIMKAGGAFVAVQLDHGADRLGFVVEDLGVRWILAETQMVPGLSNTNAEVIVLESEETCDPENGSDANLERTAADRNLAYVIYTSGSTGKPKATGIEHVSAVSFLHWAGRTIRPEHLARTLATTSPAFDCVLLEVLAPLCWGGAVILANSVLELPTLDGVTLVSTVPAAMAELIRAAGVPDSVKRVHLAGDVLTGEVVRGLHRSTGVEEVHNFYGPSEATTYATGAVCKDEGGLDGPPHNPHIGRPIDNVHVYLLDRNLNPVPIGVPGELYIGGGLARGYLNRPALTAARFVPNPFAEASGTRMYRTGDRARYLPSGDIQFLGRFDRQVKVRGFRIEPGEVESALLRHPAVGEAAVLALQDEPGGQRRLVGYVVAKADAAPTDAELRAHLIRRLPGYMVPAQLVLLDRLPLTPNGKVDTSALPAPAAGRRESWQPRDRIESELAAVWLSLLQVDNVGLDDDFFDLGGHSLLALAAVSRIQELLSVEVRLDTIFEAPTIRGLAERIRRARVPAPQPSLVKIVDFPQGRPFFCVHSAPGDVTFLRVLTRRLPFGRPVYGFHSVGMDGFQEPLTTVPAMAEHYLRELREVQPSGPYLLAGNCIGGLIAVEVAQRLLVAGERVDFLGLMDTALCHSHQEEGEGSGPSDAQELAELNYSLAREHLAELGLASVLDREVVDASGRPVPTLFERLSKVFATNARAALSYTVRPYQGRITLFTAIEGPNDPDELERLWRSIALGGLDVYPIHSGHDELGDSKELGERLRECLDRVAPAP